MCLAIPGQIVEFEPGRRSATVEFGGIRRIVSLLLLEHSTIGEWVVVHGGFAIGVLDEEEARRTLTQLAELANGEEEWGSEKQVSREFKRESGTAREER